MATKPFLSKVKITANKARSLKIKRALLERFLDRQRGNISVECYFRNVKDIPNAEVIATTGLGEAVAFSMKFGDGEIICPQFKDKRLFLAKWLEFWISRKHGWLDKYQ